MLTDYHVHLRPDEDDTPPEEYFTAANVARYREAADAAGIAELGIAEHIHRFAQALDVWRHPFWVEQAVDDIDAYCEFLSDSGLKVGIEADYVAGAEERIRDLLAARRFDYVVGSVHFVGDSAVDQDRWDVWAAEDNDPDRVWARYFERLADAAGSGLFDTMAHPDLVKVWGSGRPGPERDPRAYYEPAVEAIAAAGVAVEVSTAGLRKPIRELYPAAGFAELCVDAGIPFTLSSDAHRPAEVGYAYEQAVGVHAGPRDRRDLRLQRPQPQHGAARMSSRVGIGYDSHRLAEGRRLIIGGVEIPFERGLEGHSDADVLTHAITDAILGAAGRGGHRRALSADRRALAGRRFRRAAPQRAGAAPRAGRQRRCDGDLRAPSDRPAPGGDRAPPGCGDRRAGLGQGDHQRGPRGDRAGGGHRRDRGCRLPARR